MSQLLILNCFTNKDSGYIFPIIDNNILVLTHSQFNIGDKTYTGLSWKFRKQNNYKIRNSLQEELNIKFKTHLFQKESQQENGFVILNVWPKSVIQSK